jgi:two-component system, LuxR family, sensor kinase FixL
VPERISPPLEPSQVLPLFIDAVRDYALLMLDPAGNVASWNQGAQLIKGYAAEEIIGRSFSCFYPPEDVAAGKPQRELQHAAAAGRLEDVGYRVRKDGSRFLANVVITAVRGAGGELLGYGKVTRDVTERIEAEERVRASETRLRTLIDTLFDTVVDGLITINRDGQIQSYNNACIRQFGYTREEVIGNNVKMLMPEPDRSQHDSYLSNYLATGSAAIIGIGRNVFGQRKDGSVFPMRLAIAKTPAATSTPSSALFMI